MNGELKGNLQAISSYIIMMNVLNIIKEISMNNPNDRNIIPGKKAGVLDGLTNYFRLIARLMTDRRVNPFLKVLPIGTLVYLAIPDLVPFVIDDALVIWLGTYLFIELCPPEVVEEHRTALEGSNQNTNSGKQFISHPESNEEQGEVIDAEYWEDTDNKNEET